MAASSESHAPASTSVVVPSLASLLESPGASFWLKRFLRMAATQDLIEAASEAALLAHSLSRHADEKLFNDFSGSLDASFSSPTEGFGIDPTGVPTPAQLADAEGSSVWLKLAVAEALKRDPVDAASDAELLATVLAMEAEHRMLKVFGASLQRALPGILAVLDEVAAQPAASDNVLPSEQ
jgi:hypothetical protein